MYDFVIDCLCRSGTVGVWMCHKEPEGHLTAWVFFKERNYTEVLKIQ